VSYGHAAELQRTQPPLSRLEYLIRQLGIWADANPSLRSLHSEFVTIGRELREAGAGRIPAEIPPPGQEPGNYQRVRDMLRKHGPCTTDQIGKALGLTRGRVTQILRELGDEVRRDPYSTAEKYPWQWSLAAETGTGHKTGDST
jgi:hypothetical protein